MNKTPRLSKSGIEYLNYAWNFYSGCHHKQRGVCSVDNCWAKDIVNRFKNHYPRGFEPTYYPEAFLSPLYLKKPSVIGCAFMGDLFGDWVDPDEKIHAMMPSGIASIAMSLKGWIFTTIKQCPQHTFLFLTKNPKQLVNWGNFPDNCWVGVTATDIVSYDYALFYLNNIKAKIKYLSFEPLLKEVNPSALDFLNKVVDWVIIGSQTKPYEPPKIEWVQEIVSACDKAGVAVFLKNNLSPIMGGYPIPKANEWAYSFKNGAFNLRQEMPNA